MERYPRPSGLTMMGRDFNESLNFEEKTKLKTQLVRSLIASYVQNGYTILGKPTTLPELAQFLQVTTKRLLKEISRYSATLASISSPEEIKTTAQAIFGLLLNNAMQDRGQVQNQLNLMLTAQGGVYKPFISSEVNNTLRLLIESNRPMSELLRNMLHSTNIQVNTQINNGKVEGETVKEDFTTHEAIQLLSERYPKSLLELPEAQDQLIAAEIGIGADVEVIATKQEGLSIKDSPTIEESKKITHIDRRESDGEIIDAYAEEVE